MESKRSIEDLSNHIKNRLDLMIKWLEVRKEGREISFEDYLEEVSRSGMV